MGLTRREFLAVTVGAAITPKGAESTTLTELEASRQNAVSSLTRSIPNDPRLQYLREAAKDLPDESQMYIPDKEEIEDVYKKSAAKIRELASHIPPNSHGLYIYCDAEEDGTPIQRLYVLKKEKRGRRAHIQFVKGYLLSTAENGYGNKENSGQTPLGIHYIHSGTVGLFGQVVSGLNKYRNLFNHIHIGSKDYYFVKGFGSGSGSDEANDIAEVVTDEYLLVGPHTSAKRGIRLHGTNRSGERDAQRKWKTFLGGKKKSGGCIRMSNTDVRDLSLSGYIERGKTHVMIYATPAARAMSEKEKPKWLIEY